MPDSAGAVRAVAGSDHCLWVSKPIGLQQKKLPYEVPLSGHERQLILSKQDSARTYTKGK